MFGIDDALLGGLASGAMSLIGGQQRNQAQADQAAAANTFSAQQFATRYQTTVKDMESAGLNPMLAYSQGGGSPPSGGQASMSDAVTPAVQSAAAGYSTVKQGQLLSAQADAAKAQAEASSAQAAKTRAETPFVEPLAGADIDLKHSSAGSHRESIRFMQTQAAKITAEIKNIPKEGDRLDALVRNLGASSDLLVKQGLTEVQRRAQMEQLARKTLSDADLAGLDVDAALSFSNLGRETAQFKPIIDLLRSILRR